MSAYHLNLFIETNLTQQATSLTNLSIQQKQYAKIMKHLKTNKLLEIISKNEEIKEEAVLETSNT